LLFARTGSKASEGCKNPVPIDLDGFDLRLLAALQRDGQASHVQFAEAVGLSARAASARRDGRVPLPGRSGAWRGRGRRRPA
jgi:hypothetical protein